MTITVDLHHGDCLEVMATMEENSVDTVVTDPPYGLSKEPDIAEVMRAWLEDKPYEHGSKGFMSRSWDSFVPGPQYWREVYRVLKPGGTLLCFASTRTFDLMGIAIRFAGFEMHPFLGWVFGCLSEDTEILTPDGWKTYDTLFGGSMVMGYNVDADKLEWQQVQEVYTYAYDDTAYRIRSDSTDQLVSRNHRCLVERGGRYVFRQAEVLEYQETVPVLESMPELWQCIPLRDAEGSQKQDVFTQVCKSDDKQGKAGGASRTTNAGMADLPYLRQKVLETSIACRKSENVLLQHALLRPMAVRGSRDTGTYGKDSPQGPRCLDRGKRTIFQRENERGEQPGMEGRSNVLPQTRELSPDQVCQMPARVLGNGAQRWLHNGASVDRSATLGAMPETLGGSTPQRSRSDEQRPVKPDAIQQQHGTQEVRGTGATCPTLATVTPVRYKGIVWCVRVPTGAFVARRNGHVFVTGNSGFPKATSVSKHLDRVAGAEREVVGDGPFASRRPHADHSKQGITFADDEYIRPAGHSITLPSTPAAQLWDGWFYGKQALKPAIEPILMAQKPMDGTGFNNALTWGVAGLNIDGARVATNGDKAKFPAGVTSNTESVYGGGTGLYADRPRPADPSPAGRWPANLLLSHNPDAPCFCSGDWPDCPYCGGTGVVPGCRQVGVRRVKGASPKSTRGTYANSTLAQQGAEYVLRETGQSIGYSDPDGKEQVDAWECSEGCAVDLLARQSGTLTSGTLLPHHKARGIPSNSLSGGVDGSLNSQHGASYGDTGTAARFFQHCNWGEDDVRFAYVPKASRKERNLGLEGMPEREKSGALDVSKRGDTRIGKVRSDGAIQHAGPVKQQNTCPCVKPLSLMKYLVRLTRTPTGGVVLDPFMGSGSTGVACVLEGRSFIGIEKDAEAFDIAQRRIAYVQNETVQLTLDMEDIE